MTTARQAMDKALMSMTSEALRPRGFTGSLPHLRRRRGDRIELVSVQYYSAGGSFVVEIAVCGPEGLTTSWGEAIAPNKVTAHDINPPNRPRLGTATFPTGDHWFVFGPKNDEPGADVVQLQDTYARVAADVARFIQIQAEPWWESRVGRLGRAE